MLNSITAGALIPGYKLNNRFIDNKGNNTEMARPKEAFEIPEKVEITTENGVRVLEHGALQAYNAVKGDVVLVSGFDKLELLGRDLGVVTDKPQMRAEDKKKK